MKMDEFVGMLRALGASDEEIERISNDAYMILGPGWQSKMGENLKTHEMMGINLTDLLGEKTRTGTYQKENLGGMLPGIMKGLMPTIEQMLRQGITPTGVTLKVMRPVIESQANDLQQTNEKPQDNAAIDLVRGMFDKNPAMFAGGKMEINEKKDTRDGKVFEHRVVSVSFGTGNKECNCDNHY